MISQNEPVVEVYTREPEGEWRYKVVSGIDGTIRLSNLDMTLALNEIYKQVEFIDLPEYV